MGDDETVAFAIFRDTPYNAGDGRLLPAAFTTAKLKQYDLSLARLGWTSKRTFATEVVSDRSHEFLGVSCAVGAAIRRITYQSASQPTFRGRGVCLVDKVEEGDHDGHAAIGWGKSDAELSETSKKRAREAIKQNLADTFGRMVTTDNVTWAAEPDDTGHGPGSHARTPEGIPQNNKAHLPTVSKGTRQP